MAGESLHRVGGGGGEAAMATETAAVLVAVRVRPFHARESPLECTVTVPSARNITLTDVGSVTAFGANASGSGQQHVFTYDKIFWSIQPHVLPLCGSGMSPATRTPFLSCAESVTPTAMSRTSSLMPGMCSSSSVASTLGGATATDVSVAASRLVFSKLPCIARTPEYDDQASVYAFIGPRMCSSMMSGYNSCLFAYGQTGSGKTHSIMGPPNGFTMRSVDRGIMPRLCEDLFDMMRKEREEDESVSFNVECSFLEIYCERVRDLLLHSSNREGAAFDTASSVSGYGGGGGGVVTSSSSSSSSLRIRQHPTRGPYVEGLSLVRVRDADGVMRQLIGGLRERVTAETRMNEHSSRSHAILQMHVTRVSMVREETGVVTKTRVCKVNMVDLAGSERVAQSGATGDRFEEARNINLSLTTLGRVIMQLSEKQVGKNVVPGYRDSVLTWLLSDSLGGNSKTIMLATVAPSSYCYQQTLNTLRFAGVAKKVINVATVNEDRHFQKLITSLRQQIVKLTLQLEEGRAAEVHHEEIRSLRRNRDELEAQMDSMRATMLTMVPATDVAALQRRVADLEESTAQLHKEKNQLQRELISTTTNLREELGQKRAEIMKLHESLARKGAELQEWSRRHREMTVQRETSPPQQMPQQLAIASNAPRPSQNPVGAGMLDSPACQNGFRPPPPFVIAEPSHRREELERRVEALAKDLKMERQRRDEVEKARSALRTQLTSLQRDHDNVMRRLEGIQCELTEKMHTLDLTQSELAATRTLLRVERDSKTTLERERDLATQLDQVRGEYLAEKQTNVNLLLRVSSAEQQLLQYKTEVETRTRDVTELEHLLLEETEASERYYLRLRYYRDIVNMSMMFIRELTLEKGGFLAMELDNRNFLWEQALRDCVRDEAYSRALLEQGYFTAFLDLLGQKGLLHQITAAAANERLFGLHTTTTEMSEELQHLQEKLEKTASALEQAVSDRLTLQATLNNSESARERLSRKVEDLTGQLEHLQRSNDALIERIVEVRASQDAFEMYCEEADDTTPRECQTRMPMQQMHPQHQPERGGGQEQHCEKGDGTMSVDGVRLVKQVAQYQEEVGVLHAQLEREQNDKTEKMRVAQREYEELVQEMQRVRDECTVKLRESMQIVKEYESRITDLQDVVTTLRNALEEETHSTDVARAQMQRAEIAKRDALEELCRVTASRDALEANQDVTDSRLCELQHQLHELQLAYNELEQRLTGLTLEKADVYLTIERSSDDCSWMEKAQHEKEGLERQKRSLRRLNEELQVMVQQRNESLRAVHRQITKMQRGGVSPEATATMTPNGDSSSPKQ